MFRQRLVTGLFAKKLDLTDTCIFNKKNGIFSLRLMRLRASAFESVKPTKKLLFWCVNCKTEFFMTTVAFYLKTVDIAGNVPRILKLFVS